jgi:hypothetical protein
MKPPLIKLLTRSWALMSQTIRILRLTKRPQRRSLSQWKRPQKINAVVTLTDGSFVDRSRPGSGSAKALNDWTG